MEYSLIEKFGELPVSPEMFATLDPKLKWLGKAVEGDSWCTACGTLTPSTPRSHHPECCSYQDADTYPVWKNPLGDCPKCHSDDGLSIDSSREQEVSAITCTDCLFQYSDSVDEETLTENFKAQHSR